MEPAALLVSAGRAMVSQFCLGFRAYQWSPLSGLSEVRDMSTSVSQPTAARSSISSFQLLGLLGMTCAPGMLVDASIRRALGAPGDQLIAVSSVVGLTYLIGWTASMVGFRRLRLTGDGAPARIVFGLQMVGLTLAATQQIIELNGSAELVHSILFGICDVAWPLSHLLMLVVGAMALAKKRIRGPLRFAPLGCGLALPVSAAMNVVNHTTFIFSFGVTTTLCFGLVGLTVYRVGSGRKI
jgi:hypothetical protein